MTLGIARATNIVIAMAFLADCGGGSRGPSTAPPSDDGGSRLAVCHARSASELLECASAAANGALDEISIDGPFDCSGANACAVVIYQVTRPLLLAGNGQTVRRVDTSDYALLSISQSSHVTVSNLVFEDTPNAPDYTLPTRVLTASNTACHPTSGDHCQPTVFVGESADVLLDRLTVLHAKNEALTLASGSNLRVDGCVFRDAWLSALSIGADATQVTISDSLFEDIRSNALVVSGEKITISGNTFRHDHHAAAWWDGPGTRRPSSGGIVFIYNHSHDVDLMGNEITSSEIDEQIDPALATGEFGVRSFGVEIDYAADLGQSTDLSNIRIVGNLIHDLSGVAIGLSLEYVHDPSVGLEISGNTFYNDFVDPTTGVPISAPVRSSTYAGPFTYPFDQNCYAQICPSPQPPLPSPPDPPSISSSSDACLDGYGVSLTGTFREQAYVDVYAVDSGAFLGTYMGTDGPYAIPHRTMTLNGDGTRTLTLCFATAAERAAFDGNGVKVFIVDPYTFLFTGVALRRGQ